MANTVPWIVPFTVTLTASQQFSFQYTVSPNETVTFRKWWWTSTGIFDIFDVRTLQGAHITNATISTPIPSTFVQNPGNAFLALNDWGFDMMLLETQTLSIDFRDTSVAGNTVKCVLLGTRTYQ